MKVIFLAGKQKKEERKKEEKIEKETKKSVKKEDFNINEMYKEVNPYLRDGLKRYIFDHGIEIKNEDDFKKVYQEYGGL